MNGEDNLPAEPDVRSDLLRAIDAVILELANILSDYRDAFVVSAGLPCTCSARQDRHNIPPENYWERRKQRQFVMIPRGLRTD